MIETSSAVWSSNSATIAGIVSQCAMPEARQRRSPAISSYCEPTGRTRIG